MTPDILTILFSVFISFVQPDYICHYIGNDEYIQIPSNSSWTPNVYDILNVPDTIFSPFEDITKSENVPLYYPNCTHISGTLSNPVNPQSIGFDIENCDFSSWITLPFILTNYISHIDNVYQTGAQSFVPVKINDAYVTSTSRGIIQSSISINKVPCTDRSIYQQNIYVQPGTYHIGISHKNINITYAYIQNVQTDDYSITGLPFTTDTNLSSLIPFIFTLNHMYIGTASLDISYYSNGIFEREHIDIGVNPTKNILSSSEVLSPEKIMILIGILLLI